MFLIRTTFFLAVIIMLLPTDEANQARITGTAGIAAERAATFCERNVATCAARDELWATFVKKAEFGARLASKTIQDYINSSAGGRPAGGNGDIMRGLTVEPYTRAQPGLAPAAAPTRTFETGRGTLAPNDIAPGWRGPNRTGT